MNIGVIGLGLIGGTFSKALKENTNHTVWGNDISKETMKKAYLQEAIDGDLTPELFGKCDIVFIATYPSAAVDFISENESKFKKESIVIDLCGIKSTIFSKIEEAAHRNNFYYIGAHPMAGKEHSDFIRFQSSLFIGASMILTPTLGIPIQIMEKIKKLCLEVGFNNIKITSSEEHDRVIAFTSQLAHIVSSSYVKSPTAESHSGFTAGSFKDMTRIAKLNETMWTELFLNNKENLCGEIDTIIKHLSDYREAIDNGDKNKLFMLLKEGREKIEVIEAAEIK